MELELYKKHKERGLSYMMYDRVYDKGKEKQCWGCGEKTRYAIIKHRNIDREIPVCTKCILSLHIGGKGHIF